MAAFLAFTPAGAALRSPEGRRATFGAIEDAVRASGPFGPLLYVSVFAVAVLAVPVTPFAAAGSFIFGKAAGAALNVAGATLGAALAFAVGRYFLRDLSAALLRGRLADLDRRAGEHGFAVVFTLRLLLFPFLVVNYAAAATRIRFRDFIAATFLGIIPYLVVVSWFFGSLREIAAEWRGPADLLRPRILLPAAVLVLSFFVPAAVRRMRRRREPGAGGMDG